MYIKDPESSKLGKSIISGSIDLIHQLGFEHFTFKKLSLEIGSTEASIYRYFESKQKLLIYLSAWYWSFMEYQLILSTTNIQDPFDRLKRSIQLITAEIDEGKHFRNINLGKISRIVSNESLKIYLTKEVDAENKEGVFLPYKSFVQRISEIITEINPQYPYPRMLVSTTIEGAHLQKFFGEHLPRLTDVKKGKDYLFEFYTDIVLNAIKK